MAKSNSTEKPRWLKKRENAGRNRFPTQTRTPTHQTLEQQVASVPVKEGVSSDGGVSLPYNSGSVTLTANSSAAQSGSEKVSVYNHVPKLAYALTTAGLAVLLYAAGAVTNLVPTPSEIARQVTLKPAPAATSAPAAVTPQQDATPVVTVMPGLESILTEQQFIEYAISLRSQQPITQEILSKIDAVNKTSYYHFTGNTFENAKFIPKFLTADEYKALEGKPNGTLLGSIGTIAYGPNGEVLLYINKDFSSVRIDGPLEVLRILARETGQAEAIRRFANPQARQVGVTADSPYYDVATKYGLTDLTGTFDNPKLDLSSIFIESLQTLYQAAVFHYLEEFGVIVHPSLSDGGKDIDATVDAMVSSNNFFVQASLLDWYRAIHHTDTRESLQKTGKITSQQAIGLFNAYIQESQTREGFDQTVVEIVTAVKTSPQYAQQIKDAAKLSNRPAEFVFFP